MTTREELFIGAEAPIPVEAMNGGEFGRSPLEDYVVTEMPADLRAIKADEISYEELADKHSALLTTAAPAIEANTDTHTAEVTHMDLMFMFGGYIPAGQEMYDKAPDQLLELMQQHGAQHNLKPFMTYEQIIDLNSSEYERTGVMRTYTDGEVGKSERDFYYGHYVAEPYAKDAADKLHQLAENPQEYDVEEVLADVETDLKEFTGFMRRYGKLPKEHFTHFREYLGAYADGTRNASGAFMPSPQLLEVAMLPPSEHYDAYVDASMDYFPRWAQPEIAERRAKSAYGVNIEDKLASGELTLGEAGQTRLVAVVDRFIDFRMSHLGITRAQIPGAFSSLEELTRRHIAAQEGERQIKAPSYSGTAGFDVRNILTNSAYRLLKLRERLVGTATEEEAA